MRMVFGLVLLVGLLLAGGAVFLAQKYIGQTQAQLAVEKANKAKYGPLIEVFVVNKPVNYGDPLGPADVQKVLMQQSAMPEGAFTDPAVLFPDGEKTPRFVLRQMEKFEPVLALKVTEPGESAGLTGMLAAGERAFTIKFDAAAGISRYLQPDNYVDIYWTGANANTGIEITKLIESSVKLIAVDRAGAKGGEEAAPKTITVAATPEQIARLAQGQATGGLTVSLVGLNDTSISSEGKAPIEVDTNAMLGMVPAAPIAEVAAQQVCTIKTRKGADVIEVPVACPTN